MRPYIAGYFHKESQATNPWLQFWGWLTGGVRDLAEAGAAGADTLENTADAAFNFTAYPLGALALAMLIGGAGGLTMGYAGGKYLGGKGRPEVTRERLKTNEIQELLSDLSYRERLAKYKKKAGLGNDREIHI
jgi:hypothetical protein